MSKNNNSTAMGKIADWLGGMGKDKYMHAVLSALLCGVLKHCAGLPLAVCITVAVGIGKEVYDRVSGRGTADYRDIMADIAGTMIGVL